MAVKAGACACLAAYAWRRSVGSDGTIIAIVFALSAIADALIERSLMEGGAAFALSHIAALILYVRNRREIIQASQKAASIAVLVLGPLAVWLLTENIVYTGYGLLVGLMASLAWISAFSRYRVGAGTVLLIASNLLLFWGLRSDANDHLASYLAWPIYFLGQFMIATGVVQHLRRQSDQTCDD